MQVLLQGSLAKNFLIHPTIWRYTVSGPFIWPSLSLSCDWAFIEWSILISTAHKSWEENCTPHCHIVTLSIATYVCYKLKSFEQDKLTASPFEHELTSIWVIWSNSGGEQGFTQIESLDLDFCLYRSTCKRSWLRWRFSRDCWILQGWSGKLSCTKACCAIG